MFLCRLAIQISKSDSASDFLCRRKTARAFTRPQSLCQEVFSLFFRSPQQLIAIQELTQKKSPPPNHLQTAASTSQLFSFLKNRTAYCLQLPPRRLCSPSKAGRLLVASPFTVNSFFRLCAFFSTTRHRLPLSP